MEKNRSFASRSTEPFRCSLPPHTERCRGKGIYTIRFFFSAIVWGFGAKGEMSGESMIKNVLVRSAKDAEILGPGLTALLMELRDTERSENGKNT